MKAGNNVETWTAVCGVALVALVGAVLFQYLAPVTDIRKQWRKLDGQRKALEVRVRASSKILNQGKNRLALHTWDMPADKVAPRVLTDLTEKAKASGVKLNNFRPGKVITTGSLPAVLFDVNAVGTYNQIVDFVRKTEEPSTLLAVNSIQVTNSDGTTDSVNATVSFVGLIGAK